MTTLLGLMFIASPTLTPCFLRTTTGRNRRDSMAMASRSPKRRHEHISPRQQEESQLFS
jgi:hypothetical protein